MNGVHARCVVLGTQHAMSWSVGLVGSTLPKYDCTRYRELCDPVLGIIFPTRRAERFMRDRFPAGENREGGGTSISRGYLGTDSTA